MDGGAIGLKVGLELLKRSAPSGLAWLKTRLRGVEILLVGPGGSGKTSIADYLRLGVLEEEHDHEKTHEIERSPAFEIGIGRDTAITLRIRGAVDVPGQIGPVEHANLVAARRPQVVAIVLDGSRPKRELLAWLEQFCERLDFLIREQPSIGRRVASLSVLLNKRDRVAQLAHFRAREQAVKDCLLHGLEDALGRQRVKSYPVLASVAVMTPDGTRLLDAWVRRIAKKVAK